MTLRAAPPPSEVPTPAGEQGVVSSAARPPVSVVILTHDEEVNIADCLGTCAWCDDVHVLDSGSADRTREIAASLGATVHVHPFQSFGEQRNWAIDHIAHRHEWIFHLDADERFTPELVAEMARLIAAGPAEAAFYVPHKLMFMGRWLRRAGGGYPIYQMRLFHRDRARFLDWGHGQRERTDGQLGRLAEPYLHFNFSKGLHHWLDRHNRYSTLEARKQFDLERGGGGGGASAGKASLFGDAVQRRRFIKSRIVPLLPARWIVRFLYNYILKCGFLDGRPGLRYCQLISCYELLIGLKVAELRHAERQRGEKSREVL